MTPREHFPVQIGSYYIIRTPREGDLIFGGSIPPKPHNGHRGQVLSYSPPCCGSDFFGDVRWECDCGAVLDPLSTQFLRSLPKKGVHDEWRGRRRKVQIEVIGPMHRGYVDCPCGGAALVYYIVGVGKGGPHYWECDKCGNSEVVTGTPMNFGVFLMPEIGGGPE